MVRQIADHVIVGRHRIVAQQLPQAYKCLHSCQTGRGHVGLELQKLQLDLKIVAFADISRLQLCIADIDGLLKALEILKRELKS